MTDHTLQTSTDRNAPANSGARVTETRQRHLADLDVLETDSEFRLEVDLPGVAADGIDIRLENGILTIEASAPERQSEDVRYLLREYGSGDFFRRLRVGDRVDAEGISADFEDGVLTVHLPKVNAAKPRTIEVKSR